MKPGNLLLEKYRLGELTEEEKRQLEAQYPDPEELQQEINKLEESDAEILKKYPPRNMAAAINEKLAAAENKEDEDEKIKTFPVF